MWTEPLSSEGHAAVIAGRRRTDAGIEGTDRDARTRKRVDRQKPRAGNGPATPTGALIQRSTGGDWATTTTPAALPHAMRLGRRITPQRRRTPISRRPGTYPSPH